MKQLTPPPAKLDLDPRALIMATIGACVVAELGFLMLHGLLAYVSGHTIDPLRELFDLASETSLPHWVFMAQLLMISLTLWLICAVVKNRGARAASWLVLATFFSYMTFAHGARLYSRLGGVAERHFENRIRASGDSWFRSLMASDHAEHVLLAWLVVPLGLFTVVFLWRVLRGGTARSWLLVASVGFVVSAITGMLATRPAHLAISNLLEMAGGTVLWFLLLAHTVTLTREYRVTVDDASAPARPPCTADAPSVFHIRRTRTIRRVFLACLLVELGLVLADYNVNLRGLDAPSQLRSMFNIAREDSLPNWFSSAQTLMAAITSWMVFLVVQARAGSSALRRGWLIVALFFTYMAVDDGTRLHERIGTVFETLLENVAGAGLLQRFPSYAWQVFFVPLFAAAGLFTAWFLLRHSPRSRTRAVVLLALGLLGLAVGLDFLEGLGREHPWNPYTYLVQNFDLESGSRALFRKSAYFITRHFSKVLEEIFEMLANTLLWIVFLGYLFDLGAKLRIRVVRNGHRE